MNNDKIVFEEVRKSEIKSYVLFFALVFYIFAVLIVLNPTLGKINTLICDFTSLLCIVAGVYFLFRCKVLSYRYMLYEDKFCITRISGKNNELMQFEISLGKIEYLKKTDLADKNKKTLKYCVPFSKEESFVFGASTDDESYTVVFQPSAEFLDKLKTLIKINED